MAETTAVIVAREAWERCRKDGLWNRPWDTLTDDERTTWVTVIAAIPAAIRLAQRLPGPVRHTGMLAHDGYAPHSHEVRPDHAGVQARWPPESAGTCRLCGAPLNRDESCSADCAGVGDG